MANPNLAETSGQTEAGGVLTAEQQQEFERDGYVVFDPEIPNNLLEGAVADLENRYRSDIQRLVEDDGVVYGGGPSPRIKDAWRLSDNVKAIAVAPKVLVALRTLYGRKPLPFQTLNFIRGSQQEVHSDAMHFIPEDPAYMCGVWVALEDIGTDNGPLVYYPGSHKLPIGEYEDVGFTADRSEFATYDEFMNARNLKYEEHIRNVVRDRDLQPAYGTIRKGEALIWASNLLHGGMPHVDKDRTRHSEVTHYLFEGSTAYRTPMRTEGDKEYWSHPDFLA